MEDNPLFNADIFDVESSSTSSAGGESYTGPTATNIGPPTTTVLQTVNIKSHVPVVLELTEPNYDEWRTFFDAFIGKFGLGDHLSSLPTPAQRHDRD
jgi:hypothetical protein